MEILKFIIYWEDDDSVYRDVVIRHTSTFADLHHAVLKAYEFDNKHKATFYRSNDNWLRGREISLEKYDDKTYKVDPLIMAETPLRTEIKDPNQKFIYVYDFNKFWTFRVELINVDKEENKKITYPSCVRTEGIAPSQYGTKGIVDSRLAEMEEKYDLTPTSLLEGFSQEDEDGNATTNEEEEAGTEEAEEEI